MKEPGVNYGLPGQFCLGQTGANRVSPKFSFLAGAFWGNV
jgi:hypothetical protein